MAGHAGRDHAAVADRLTGAGHRFDFCQAMLLLELLTEGGPRPGEAGPLAAERIRLRSHPSWGFPPGDVHEIRRVERAGGPERFEVALNFLGLVGMSSPLPSFFSEPVISQLEGGQALGDFLALFEHRLYSLYWRAWKRSRLDVAAHTGERRALRLLLHLAGIAPQTLPASSALEPVRLVAFAGCLGTPHRTAAGLRGLVSGYFGGLPVRVEQCRVHRVLVPEPARLGAPEARLGDSVLLGDTTLDGAGHVGLRVGPLDLESYQALLPAGAWAEALGELVRLYLPAGLDFDLQLELQHDQIPACRLGAPETRLGWLSWLGRPAGNGVSGALPAAAYAAAGN